MQLRLLAPFLPYVTEEVWSWWQEGSVHRAPWPVSSDLGAAAAADPAIIDAVAAALAGIRGAKSQAKVSMRAELARVEVIGSEAQVAAVRLAAEDLRKVGKITGELVLTPSADATEISVLTPSWPRRRAEAQPAHEHRHAGERDEHERDQLRSVVGAHGWSLRRRSVDRRVPVHLVNDRDPRRTWPERAGTVVTPVRRLTVGQSRAR